MRLIRIITAALAVVLSISAVTASGAFAVIKKAELVKAGGGSLVKTKVKATSGEAKLELVSEATFICKSDSIVGEVLSRTSLTATITFNNCKISTGQKCKGGNAGPTGTEEIKLGGLLVDVVYTPGSSKEKLLLLTRVPGTFSFKCAEVTEELKGSFLSAVRAANENAAKTLFLFSAGGTKGVQEFTNYELPIASGGGEHEASLEFNLSGEGFKQGALIGTEDTVFEEAVEYV